MDAGGPDYRKLLATALLAGVSLVLLSAPDCPGAPHAIGMHAGPATSPRAALDVDSGVAAAIRRDLYAMRPAKSAGARTAWHAANVHHGLEASFSANGLVLRPGNATHAGWTRFTMQLAGHGRPEHLHSPGPAAVAVEGARIEYRRPGLVEWYVNEPRGIEQGFTVAERPAGDGPLVVELAIESEPQLALEAEHTGLRFARADGLEVLRYRELFAYDASGTRLDSRMELVGGSRVRLVVEDGAAAYPVVIDPTFDVEEKLTASDPAANDEFGTSVSVSGDWAVVGAPNNDAAYLYYRHQGGTGQWGQFKKLTGSNDAFGFAVAIHGDIVVVGDYVYRAESYVGAAHVFQQNKGGTNNWGLVKQLEANDWALADEFGYAVAVSDDRIVVGAPNKDLGKGAAYIYRQGQGGADNWGLVKKITASDSAADDFFGFSVAISSDGTDVIVGAPYNDDFGTDSGSVYVFEKDTGGTDNWGEQAISVIVPRTSGDHYGWSVAISSNDWALVGIPGFRSGNGATAIYQRSGTSWSWKSGDTLSGGGRLGTSVDLDDDASNAIAGRPAATSSEGTVQTYSRSGSTWSDGQTLTASDHATGDGFGSAVSIDSGTDEDTVLVGAPFDDDGGGNAGSAYILYDCLAGCCQDSDCEHACSTDSCDSSGTCLNSPFPSSTVCRSSTGPCDVAETCTGFDEDCPADSLASSSTVCRSSAGACDVAETCTGSSASCPSDSFASSSTVCRSSAGACDVAESCTGSSASCPSNSFAGSSTVCRSSAGACDIAERCTGSSASCPSNSFAGSSTVCRSSAGACDVSERCTGSSASCPSDSFASSSTVCRSSAGACDVAESCTGSSASCPSDSFSSSTTVCRSASGVCDVAESCTGSAAVCPSDEKSVDVCRPSTGACDVEESCDGVSDDCPADTGLPDTDVDGECDAVDPCTNVSSERDFLVPSKVIVAKINLDTTPGNDKLVVSGSFLLPAGTIFADLMPDLNGARVLLESEAGSVVLDATLPAGAYDSTGKRGWKTNTSHTSWKYSDKTTAPIENITSLGVKDQSKKVPGKVRIKVTGKKGTYPVAAGDEPLHAIVVLGNQTDAAAGWCAESNFTADECSYNGSQSTLKCVSTD